MKRLFFIIFLAMFVGTFFAFYMFQNIENSIALSSNENKVTAFQVGVFKNLENAENLAKDYESSLVYKDNEYYRVFLAIYHDPDIIKSMQQYFQKYPFYLKELDASDKFLTKLAKYETLLKKSNLTNYKEINQNILNEFKRDSQ